ncbi:hypothetical protein [Bacillus cereus]|uniref:hypothetical protein n=1 Tax=Bacillus cereus TaxID=1396 RepID=UPI0005CF1A33|nr:hypothetical protein [Bacillus cereus]
MSKCPGQLYIIGCNSFPLDSGTVAFIAEDENLDLTTFIVTSLGLAIVQDQGTRKNIFTAVTSSC